ncbi:MAG TPA: peptidylprolyl isomerase [Pyrinomonadaceae bacterium]|nr:peptidylprolyl isomerase [Pyrinomonadaceae bacterium]
MKYELKKFAPIAAAVLLLISGYSFAQSVKAGSKFCVDKFGREQYAILIKDLPDDAKPKLADAEYRKAQVENLRQLLAFECEAEKRGLAKDETNAAELDNIRSEIVAVNYDRETNKGAATPTFSRITDTQVAEFYGNTANNAAFDRFLKAKLALMSRDDPQMAAHVVTDEEKKQAKDYFAKIKISENESVKNAASLGTAFKAKTDLQANLQQAQFLARALSGQLLTEMSATDEEVAGYIKTHPELDTSAKKAEAEKVLTRAKSGEDFATLADQYSDDPGNSGTDGKKNGGLYSDVPKGTMVAPFETAALSLQPGTVYPDLVESDFGYHIIKLEKKTGTGDALKYDVRHILFATTVKDPSNPNGRELPIKEYVRTQVETGKQSAVIAKIVADNPITMDDFAAPQTATASAKSAAAKPAAKKPVAKKRVVRRRH